MHEARKTALAAIGKALYEAVVDSPKGIAGGHLYAAVMSLIPLSQFEAIMTALVEIGSVAKRGELYFPA